MTLEFKDAAGVPLTPSTVEWRVDDLTNSAEVRAWTALGGISDTMTVIVTGADNVITKDKHVKEVQLFGIRVDDGLAGEGHAELEYNVLNLKGPTGP